MQNNSHPRLGIFISLIAYFFFAVASSLVYNFGGRFPTIQIIFIQNCVSFLCILPIALRKGFHRLKTQNLSVHLIRDIMGVLSYYLYFVAIRYLNLTDATTLNYCAPFFVPLVWWIWMKGKMEHHVWWSIIIGFIGVAIILNPSREIFQEGFIFGISAAVASAVAFAALRILSLQKEPMSRTLFYYFLFGSAFSLPFAIVYWVPATGIEWCEAIGIGVTTAVGQMLLTISYRYGTASFLSPLGYSTVIYVALSSWIIFHIPPTFRSLIGIFLIVLGGTLTYLFQRKPRKLAQTFEAPDPKDKPPL